MSSEQFLQALGKVATTMREAAAIADAGAAGLLERAAESAGDRNELHPEMVAPGAWAP